MTVDEVIAFVEAHVEESYTEAEWIRYINAALDDLTPGVRNVASKADIALTIVDNAAEIDLTTDEDLQKAYQIISVYFTSTTPPAAERFLRFLPLTDNYSEGWKMTAKTIKLQNLASTEGTARVEYFERLAHVTDGEDDLTDCGLTPQYHNLVALYCMAKCQQKEEELEDKNDLFSEYLNGKRQMILDRLWATEPHTRKYINKARMAALLGSS